MKKKLIAASSLVILGSLVVVVRGRTGAPHHPHHDTTTVHATGIDQNDTNASISILLTTRDAATPCDTAFDAIDAERSAAKLRGGESMFTWVADRPAFMTACQALPAAVQQCMVPHYRRDHDQECARLRPPDATLKQMFVAGPIVEPTYEM